MGYEQMCGSALALRFTSGWCTPIGNINPHEGDLTMTGTSPKARRWKQTVAVGAGFAALASVAAVQAGPTGLSASSHREAPLIAGDPRADNTDVYAFVSPDDPDTVTVIANWLPFEEPNGGPNFYPWATGTPTEGARYNIKIDNDGDAFPDLTYEWTFETIIKDAGQFLYNTGPFDSVTDPELNVYQTYDLTVITDPFDTPGDPSDDLEQLLLDDAIAAPSIAGATSTPDYQPLVDEAVASGQIPGGGQSFVGQADDPFFLDLRVFDLLYGADATEVGEDTLAGYNVNSIALQLPKDALALNGSATDNPVIGIWSTTDRSKLVEDEGTALPGDETVVSEFQQVSRLGNPLVNEVVLPLALKDAFNSIPPTADATIPEAVDAVQNPILPPIVEAVYGVPAPEGERSDLVEIFLQGISIENDGLSGDPDENPALKADLNSLALNADVSTITPSEMLRLNMAVPVTPEANASTAGVIGGDFQGFPNGRRLEDDILDAAFQVTEGIVFKDGADLSALAVVDSVDRNDREFSDVFPYLALPHVDSVVNGTERTPRAPEFVSVEAERVLETRTTTPGGQIGYNGTKPVADQKIDVDVSGVVPDDAAAVFVTVSAIQPDVQGYVTVYADCDNEHPTAASLNPLVDTNVSNLVAAELDDDGSICLYTSGSTHLAVDVNGYQPSTSSYLPNAPERVLETRANAEGGQVGYAGPTPAADDVITVKVTETPGAGLAADTAAVVLNVTSIRAAGNGFVTAYPCDEEQPVTANLNLEASTVRGNLLVSKVSAAGTVCLYTSSGTELTADLQGSYPAGTSYVPIVPERLLETRQGVPGGRIGHTGDKPIDGEIIELKVIGVGTNPAPEGSGTVMLNIAAIQAESNGYITVFECGTTMPLAANGVYAPGANTSTLVAAPVNEDGRTCVFTSGSAHITADISGYFPGTQLVG
jgi:Domain of unknown function (DUF4331)